MMKQYKLLEAKAKAKEINMRRKVKRFFVHSPGVYLYMRLLISAFC